MKTTMNKKILALIITTLLVAVLFVNGSADGTTPGSEADPIVTQSYVELKSEQTKYYIDNLLTKNNQEIAALKAQLEEKNQEILKLQEQVKQFAAGGGDGGFQVVLLNKDKSLLAGSGAELIIRSGKVTAIKGTNGGLANVTSAKDLNTGDAVVLNNLLISSRDDGRGVKAVVDSYLLIRGAYTIK